MEALKHAHSGLRWVVLILLIMAIVNAYKGKTSKLPYTDKDKKIHLFAMVFLHIQTLLGFISYFMNFGGKVDFSNMSGNPVVRFFTVEHSFMMILALIIITVGFSRSKKIVETPKRFNFIFVTYLIGLVLILAGIPWPFRAALGAGWF